MNVAIRQNETAAADFARRFATITGVVALALVPTTALIAGWVGLGLSLAAAIAVLGALISTTGRAALLSVSGLAWPAAGFAAGIGAIVLAMTPLAPGGAHPLWTTIGGGGAVLDREAALEGVLALCGVAAAFLLSAAIGARSDRARRAIQALAWASLVEAVGLVVVGAAGLAGVPALLAGFSVLLQFSRLIQIWKVERPRGWSGRFSTAPGALAAIGFGLVCVAALSGWGDLVALVAAGVLLGGWEALDATGQGRMRRGPLFVVLSLVGLALAGAAVSTLSAIPAAGESGQVLSNDVHWRAVLASPWLGYGPGSAPAVAALEMDRRTLPALLKFPNPDVAYLSALEQVGALGVAPFALAVIAVLATLINASVRRRRATGLYRLAAAAAGYYALVGLVSAAPLSSVGAAPLAVLVGCAFGAAKAAR